MTVMAIAPPLGGQVLALAGRRAIFWTLVGVGLVTLAALFTLPETLAPERRNHEPLTRALANYRLLIREKRLMGYAAAGGFFYGGMFAYIAGTPFAYISYYHVPPQLYGLLFGAGILGIMVTNLVNARLVLRLGGARLLLSGRPARRWPVPLPAARRGRSAGWSLLRGLGPPRARGCLCQRAPVPLPQAKHQPVEGKL
jgi:MFS transporter, DHA1 family, multidrug resistance protein